MSTRIHAASMCPCARSPCVWNKPIVQSFAVTGWQRWLRSMVPRNKNTDPPIGWHHPLEWMQTIYSINAPLLALLQLVLCWGFSSPSWHGLIAMMDDEDYGTHGWFTFSLDANRNHIQWLWLAALTAFNQSTRHFFVLVSLLFSHG